MGHTSTPQRSARCAAKRKSLLQPATPTLTPCRSRCRRAIKSGFNLLKLPADILSNSFLQILPYDRMQELSLTSKYLCQVILAEVYWVSGIQLRRITTLQSTAALTAFPHVFNVVSFARDASLWPVEAILVFFNPDMNVANRKMASLSRWWDHAAQILSPRPAPRTIYHINLPLDTTFHALIQRTTQGYCECLTIDASMGTIMGFTNAQNYGHGAVPWVERDIDTHLGKILP